MLSTRFIGARALNIGVGSCFIGVQTQDIGARRQLIGESGLCRYSSLIYTYPILNIPQ